MRVVRERIFRTLDILNNFIKEQKLAVRDTMPILLIA